MNEDNPPQLSSSRPYRIRRPSSSIISSTTSPAFPAPANPSPAPAATNHRSRLAASLNLNIGGNNNNSNNANSINNNNGRDIDEDLACQPSSSTTNFTPPSPRPRPMTVSSISSSRTNNSGSISPLGSPDSTFWGTAPSPISNFRGHGPATPGGMCQVSSSTVDDVPPSPMQFDDLNVTNSSNTVMLPPVAKSGRENGAGSSSTSRTGSTPILLSSLEMSVEATASSSSSSSSSSNFNSTSSFSSNTLRNKIKKASSFERFSMQAASNNLTSSHTNSSEVIVGPERILSERSVSERSTLESAGSSTMGSSFVTTNPTVDAGMTPGNNNSMGNSMALAGNSGILPSSGFTSNASNSLPGTSLNSLSATNNPILAASLSTAPNMTNSSGAPPTDPTTHINASNSSSSSSTRFLWDSIIQSSGASALRQLFNSSSSLTSEGKSLHIKIPSKKLAAKIASVFEQEEQQLLQQQQNDLMTLLTGHNQSQSDQSGPNTLQAGANGLHASANGLNLPHGGVVLGDDPVVDLMNDVTVNESHENLIRELSESPLNLTDTSANTNASHLRNSRNLLSSSNMTSALTSNLASSVCPPKKIPLTPKQKLLHRMQSGELLSLTPPPLNQQQQQQQGPILQQSSPLSFHNGSLLQESLQQSQPSPHQLDPYYDSLLRNRDDFIPDNLPLTSSKNSDQDPNAVSVLYDADAYSYYYGNMLSDEIFATTTTTSSTTSTSARPLLMLPGSGGSGLQEAVDSLQTDSRINSHGHVEFILGIDDDMDGRGTGAPRDDLQLDPQQFLDGENLNKAQTDSTLRNLLMMGPIQHEDTNWIHTDYSRSGRSVQMNGNGSNGQNLNMHSWMLGNDWTRGSWGHVGMGSNSTMQTEEQDEVMDMSVMDSPEKHKQRHGGHLVDQHDIDDVDLLGSMQMPMDLQQPLGLINTTGSGLGMSNSLNSGGSTLGMVNAKGQMVHENVNIDANNPVNLQHQHRCATASLDEDEPVNLMAVNLDSDLTPHHHHSNQTHTVQSHHHSSQTHTVQSHHHSSNQHQLTEDMDHLPNTVLQHSSMLSNRHHSNHMDSNKQSQIQCGGYITLHAAPPAINEYVLPSQELNSSTSSSSDNDNIDERRIIRVKKSEVMAHSPNEDDCSGVKMAPSIILDKPIQPKSFASLPSPLSLIRVAGNGWAVFTARYKTIAVNTRFGPVEGPLKRALKEDMTNMNAAYPCLVMLDSSNTLWQLDRTDDELCNWMKFVRFARNSGEQNAVITEERGLLYFSTMKEIPPKTELQVGYSLEYAQKYGLPLHSTEEGAVTEIFQNDVSSPGASQVIHSSGNERRDEEEDGSRQRDQAEINFEEVFSCYECQQDFLTSQELNSHLESEHRENPLPDSIEQRPCKKKNVKKYKFLEEAFSKEPSSSAAKQGSKNASVGDILQRGSIGGELQDRCSGEDLIGRASEGDLLGRTTTGGGLTERSSGELLDRTTGVELLEKENSVGDLERTSGDLERGTSGIKRGRYECNTCQAIVPTLVDLTKHVAQHYEQDQTTSPRPTKVVDIEEPRVTNSSSKSVLTSTQQVLNERKWKEKEGSGGGAEASPTAVISTTSVITKVKCSMCYKSFATKDRLDKHMIVHSDEETKPLQCEFCPKRFLTNSALAGHIKTHAEEGKCFECPMCDFVTQQLLQLKEHVQTHKSKENGMFYCPKCSKKFLMYSMVRKHIRAFHGPRQFTCDQCPMCFPTSDKLKLHKLKHSDHREFLCAECGRQFKRKDKLREHTKRMHENRKKPVDLHQLHGHLSKHRHSKKFVPKTSPEEFQKFIYKCADCMMGFKRRGMLVNHLAKRHPEKPPQQVPELNMPILRPTRNYFCPYCDRVYKSSSKRKSHILKSHPGKALPPQLKGKDSLCLNEADRLITVCVSTSDTKLPHSSSKEKVPAEKPDTPTIITPNPQQYREVSVVGKVMATPHSCEWCHRQYATRAKLLQHQRKSHLHLMPPDMQLPRTQKNNVVRQMEAEASNGVHITSANIISGNVTLNGTSGIVFATSSETMASGGNSEATSAGVISSGGHSGVFSSQGSPDVASSGTSGTVSSCGSSGTILSGENTGTTTARITSGATSEVISCGTSGVIASGASARLSSGNTHIPRNYGAAEVIVAHILKNEVLSDQMPSSSTSLSVALAPDSSTQPETVITVDSSNTIATTGASSSTNNTTTIALTEHQLQQLQLQGLAAGGEESGNVIGFLLTTSAGDIGGLVPSEIVVVPMQHHQQHSQHYPVISAATASAIQQAVLSTTSSGGANLTNGATLLPLTSSNHSNILSNVISSAVAGINIVNPILNPTE